MLLLPRQYCACVVDLGAFSDTKCSTIKRGTRTQIQNFSFSATMTAPFAKHWCTYQHSLLYVCSFSSAACYCKGYCTLLQPILLGTSSSSCSLWCLYHRKDSSNYLVLLPRFVLFPSELVITGCFLTGAPLCFRNLKSGRYFSFFLGVFFPLFGLLNSARSRRGSLERSLPSSSISIP